MLRPGRPLSFLAGLDLAEVRAAGGDDRLPGEGWLLFFADLDNDEDGLMDCAPNEEGMPARVLFVPAGQSPVEVAVPAELIGRDGLRPQPASGRVRPLPDPDCRTTRPPTGSASTSTRRSPGMRSRRSSRRAGRPPIGPCPRRTSSMTCCAPPPTEAAGQAGWVEEDWTRGRLTDASSSPRATRGPAAGFAMTSSSARASPAEGVEAVAPDFDPVAWIGQLATTRRGRANDDVLDRPRRAVAAEPHVRTRRIGSEDSSQGYRAIRPSTDTVLLLHLGFDHELGFEFLDNGAIQFRIPADALAAHDWSQVTAEADSG